MDPFRKKKARHALLEALEMADGYPLADSVLRSYLQDLVKPPLKDAEWKDLTADALKNDLIVQVPNKLDPEILQYTITERGQAVVRN
jgi:Cys-tRNA synthase (O-phospho-L-seryl-tRNA:Cys-tRNA synthase)